MRTTVTARRTAFAGVRGLRRPLVYPTFTLAVIIATTTATLIIAITVAVSSTAASIQ